MKIDVYSTIIIPKYPLKQRRRGCGIRIFNPEKCDYFFYGHGKLIVNKCSVEYQHTLQNPSTVVKELVSKGWFIRNYTIDGQNDFFNFKKQDTPTDEYGDGKHILQ